MHPFLAGGAWLALSFLFCFAEVGKAGAAVRDEPFLQDQSFKFRKTPELAGAQLRRLEVDRNGAIYVLTDRGVARVFEDTLALDRSFRPLTGLTALDIALRGHASLYYLFDDRWLSNEESGEPLGHLPRDSFRRLAVREDGAVLVSGPGGLLLFRGGRASSKPVWPGPMPERWLAHESFFVGLSSNQVVRLSDEGATSFHEGNELTALAFRGEELLIGTRQGYYGIDWKSSALVTPRQTRLPVVQISCLLPVRDGVWAGTPRGVFFQRRAGTDKTSGPHLPDGPNGIRYYASKRWLADDEVVDLKEDWDGNLLVLTKTGLNRIEFREFTLAEKAAWYDRKIRLRHVRFGLAGERRLPIAGEVTSSEIIDTDNDGGWSSYYLGSQAYRYAVTRSEEARANAWETFAALERLLHITGLDGFFARTFERKGFKYSDPERWRNQPGGDWEWKGHTSSDEFSSHTFAHAVMWELVARTAEERRRVADNYTRILDHIIRNDWYLIDVDGKPTLWGRWNPAYVNWYPPSIADRRLNSAEIIAGLQLGWKMTGDKRYREKAEELFQRHGYLTNILSSMKLVRDTPGFIHQGEHMGDEWNHSDDELAFVIYWVLYRFAFTRELRAQYAAAIRDHWEIEKAEKFPVWNFVFAACGGGADCDAAGAVWTLRGWPLDTITWRIQNSHRQDITRLPGNFYRRELEELLPPGERQIVRINTQPFILDGGDGGHTEFPGDEYLFGYWLGRYVGAVGNSR